MSETNLSGSLTVNASPLGKNDTMEGSSLLSISINFRGKGLECPVPDPDPDVVDDDEEGAVAVVVGVWEGDVVVDAAGDCVLL